MSTLRVSKISGRKEAVGTKFTIDNDTTYIAANIGKKFTSSGATGASNAGVIK